MKKILVVIMSVLISQLSIFMCFASAEENGEVFPQSAAEGADESILTVNTAMSVDVAAKACVLMDMNTGTVLMCNNEHEKLYPASVTKIMTLLLVCEAIESGKLTLDMTITCSQTAAEKGGSQIWLEAGEEMTINDLFKAAVVYSANDACTLLGETVAGSEEAFVIMMNEKAKALGMNDTNFENCTGLDDDTETHKTTAYDIAIMSRELLKHDLIYNYTKIWMDTLRNGQTQLVNTNKLIRYYSGANGLKTGTTSKAGCCVSASAERDGLTLIAVVLGAGNSNDRFDGAKKLLDWGFANYEIYTPKIELAENTEVAVTNGVSRQVSVKYGETEDILINKGGSEKIKQTIELTESVAAPVEKGQNLGRVVFTADGAVIAEYSLTASEEIEAMTLKNSIITMLKSISF